MIYSFGRSLNSSLNDVKSSLFFSQRFGLPIANLLARVSSAWPQATKSNRTLGVAGDAASLKAEFKSAKRTLKENWTAFGAETAAMVPPGGPAKGVFKGHISAVGGALEKNKELTNSRKLARAIAVFRDKPAGTNALADKDNIVKKITRYAASLSLPVVDDWAVKVAEKNNLFSVRDVEIAKVAQPVFDIFKEEGIKGFERGSAEHKKALLLLEELVKKIDATANGTIQPQRGLPPAEGTVPEKNADAAHRQCEPAPEKNETFEEALDATVDDATLPPAVLLSKFNMHRSTMSNICSSKDSPLFKIYDKQIREFGEMPKVTGNFMEADKALLGFVSFLAFPFLTTRGREFDAYRGVVETAERFSLIDDSHKKIAHSALQLVDFLEPYKYRTITFGSPVHKRAQSLAGDLLAEIGRVHSESPQLAAE